MKVLVCLKHVLDHQLTPRIEPAGLSLDFAQQKMSINPFDEVALEQAVRLKEAGLVQEVHVVCYGPAAAQNSLRTALALGADHAQLLETDAPLTPRQISKHLAMLIQEMRPDLVLCGKQACDDDAGQVPLDPPAAALLLDALQLLPVRIRQQRRVVIAQ